MLLRFLLLFRNYRDGNKDSQIIQTIKKQEVAAFQH